MIVTTREVRHFTLLGQQNQSVSHFGCWHILGGVDSDEHLGPNNLLHQVHLLSGRLIGSDKCKSVWKIMDLSFCDARVSWGSWKVSTEGALKTVLMCEVFACLHMQSLSPFSRVEAEHNEAVVVWACSAECPLSLTLTSFPFISSPSSSFEQLPPEWLGKAHWEVLLCSPLL